MKYILLLLAFTLSACGGGGSDSTSPAATVVLPDKTVFAPTVVVLEGDSLTELNEATTWPTTVKTDSKWSATWANFAVGGSTTTMMLDRYSNVYAKKPSGTVGVFIFNGGSNDLSFPHGPDPSAEIYERLKTMWRQARADGFKVVGFTIHNGRSLISPEFAKEQFAKLNSLIRSDPSLYDALVENDKLFPDTSDSTMLYDGLHFTPAANVRVVAAVETALATLK